MNSYLLSDGKEREISQNKERLIIIMRHGERTDLAGFTTEINEYDPELTENGKNQAYEAGKRLNEFLELKFKERQENFKHKNISIISSPFTRTLETAKYMKNGLELNIPIFVENGLSEFISKAWFRNSPIDFLCYYKIFKDNISNYSHDDNDEKKFPKTIIDKKNK
jgi:hypothetical protein